MAARAHAVRDDWSASPPSRFRVWPMAKLEGWVSIRSLATCGRGRAVVRPQNGVSPHTRKQNRRRLMRSGRPVVIPAPGSGVGDD